MTCSRRKNIRDNEALAYLHAKKCWFTIFLLKFQTKIDDVLATAATADSQIQNNATAVLNDVKHYFQL